MSKRINIMLPEETLKMLDRVAAKGDRSRFVSQAVLHYVQSQSQANLRQRLKESAMANAKTDLEIAQEWFPLENEAWQKLEAEEAKAKRIRGGAKFTSRRSTRRSGTK